MRVSHILLVFTILIIYVYSIPVEKTQEKSDSISSLLTERFRRSTTEDAPMKWRWFLFIFLYGLLIMLLVIACFLWKCYKSKRQSAPPNKRTEASEATSDGQKPTPDQISLISNDSSNLEEHLNNELDQKDCPENLKELPIHERIYYLSYNSKYEIDEKNLKKRNIFLGHGSFGTVFKDSLRKANGKNENDPSEWVDVAVKNCINTNDREKVQMFYEELKIMCKIGRHPNVLALVGATTTKMGADRTLIITELTEEKDLLKFLRKRKKQYVHKFVKSETGDNGYLLPNSSKRKKEYNVLDDNLDFISTFDLLSFAYQIANGMEYLAKVPLVHRDLALRNVLIKNNKIIRIADFGLSRRHDDNKEYYKPRDIWNTDLPICHVSPDCFKSKKFTQKSDVWSFGVCLFEIFSLGDTPYEKQNKSTLIEYLDKGNRLEIPKNCHPDVAKLMKMCWHSNPDIRPDFAMCKEYFESHLEESASMLLAEIKQKLQNEAVEQEKLEDWIKKDEAPHNNDSLTTTVPPVTTRSTTQMPLTTTKNSNIPAASCGKRVIGYYTEWEKPEVSEKQLNKLTHIIYLFAKVQENCTITLDGDRSENRFLDMKNKAMALNSGLKMMIGVGGHANSVVFSPLMKDVGKRKTLIDSIASFIDENDLDGVDIFWTWSHSADKLHHSKFIKELRKRLNDLKSAKSRNEEYLISVIVPPSVSHLDSGYYLNEIMKHVDFLNVLTYDYYYFNGNQNRVGPHSPIYGGSHGNIDETMNYLASKTKKPNKLNMAVPFYGTFWTNASLPLHDDSDDIWKEKGDAKGPFAMRYNQFDSQKWDKSSARFHEKSKTSYIWIPETKLFVTFENEKSLGEKTKYVKEKDLGGMLIWAIDQDDEENTLLNAVSSADVCSETEKKSVEYNFNN